MLIDLTSPQKIKLLHEVRKILKIASIPPTAISQVNLIEEIAKGKIIARLHINNLNFLITKDIEKKIKREIKKQYAQIVQTQQKIKNKSTEKNISNVSFDLEIEIELVEENKPQFVNKLIQAIADLQPQPTTPSTIKEGHKLFIANAHKQQELLDISVIITILGAFIWPELSGKAIDPLYRQRDEDLQPNYSPESNAFIEARYLNIQLEEWLKEYSSTFSRIIPLANFSSHLSLIDDHKLKFQKFKELSIQCNQLEEKLAIIESKIQRYIQRTIILKRVCQSIDNFFARLTKQDIPELWEFYEEYQEKTPGCLKRIDELISGYETYVAQMNKLCSDLTKHYDYTLNELEQALRKEREERRTKYREAVSLLEKNNLLEDLPTKEQSEKSLLLPQIKSDLTEQITPTKIKTKPITPRKIKEESLQTPSIKTKMETLQTIPSKPSLYVIVDNNSKSREEFNLSADNVLVIHSEMKFYALEKGLTTIEKEFKNVLINKANRGFLSLTRTGKAGIKLLAEDILVVKTKDATCSDRLILMGIKVNKIMFFLPVVVVNHSKWEDDYALNPAHPELETLRQKLKREFVIKKADETPSKIHGSTSPLEIQKKLGQKKPAAVKSNLDPMSPLHKSHELPLEAPVLGTEIVGNISPINAKVIQNGYKVFSQNNPVLQKPNPKLVEVKALRSYEAQSMDELSFKEGDMLTLLPDEGWGEGWLYAELDGKRGNIPESYIQLDAPISSQPRHRKLIF